jgi:hypothetical protein
MTDERTLHDTDRAQWLAYVAPNMARKIATDTDEQVRDAWPRIPDDYKAAVWKQLDAAQRERIRKLRGTK